MICIYCGGFVTLPGNSTDPTSCVECGRAYVPAADHGWFNRVSAIVYVPKDDDEPEQG